jgi:N-acetylmuramoyl-L-alanine amidase
MTLKVSSEAGHAGFGVTPGKRALDGSMYEWEFNDGCIRHFTDELSKYEGVEQLRVDDPTGKRDVPLAERAQRVNNWGSNLHVSFHGNAGPTTASGIETFVYPKTTEHNRQVAQTIHNHIINATGRKNRGLKTADFQILRTTKMEALLIEGGFMTNSEELALMKTDAYRSKVGRAAAAGVAESFGLKRKSEPKPQAPVTQAQQPQQGIGVLTVVENTVIRKDAIYTADIIRAIKTNEGEFLVHDYLNGWYNIGGWVHKNYVKFTPHTNVKITKG